MSLNNPLITKLPIEIINKTSKEAIKRNKKYAILIIREIIAFNMKDCNDDYSLDEMDIFDHYFLKKSNLIEYCSEKNLDIKMIYSKAFIEKVIDESVWKNRKSFDHSGEYSKELLSLSVDMINEIHHSIEEVMINDKVLVN